MPLANRIKCAASIDPTTGAVILADAKSGFRALTVGWAAVLGEYPYVLETADGTAWEIGLVRVNGGGSQTTFSGKLRLIIDSSSGTGFANGTTGLVFSQAPLGGTVWTGGLTTDGGNTSTAPQATGNNMAAGSGASASGYSNGLAIGTGALVQDTGGTALGNLSKAVKPNGTAVGSGAVAGYSGETALGTNNLSASVRFLPMTSVIYSAGTATFTTVDAFNPTINFYTWSPDNKQSGAIRLTGTVSFDDGGHPGNSAYSRVFSFDYTLWFTSGVGVVVLGTPTFTTQHAGASAVAVTMGVNATTGAMTMTTTGAGYLVGKAIARIDNMAC